MDQGLFDDILKMPDLDTTRNNRIKNANRKQNKQQPIPPQSIVDRGQYFLNSLHIDDPFSRLFPIQIDRICPGCPTVLVRNFDTNISFVTLKPMPDEVKYRRERKLAESGSGSNQ